MSGVPWWQQARAPEQREVDAWSFGPGGWTRTYPVGDIPPPDPVLARLDRIEEKLDRLLDEQARRAILDDYRRLTGREP